MSRPPRRLFLHLSALSDEEYNTYLAALRDVIDDEDKLADGGMDNWSEEELENRVLGVREVRAWMKGRYRDVNDIDKILRLFSPELSQKDTIRGGQFLAAMRLVMHARNGVDVSEGNVFVQVAQASPTVDNFVTPPPVKDPATTLSAPAVERTNPFRLEPPTPTNTTLPPRRLSLSHLPPSTRSVPASSASDISLETSVSHPSPSKPSSLAGNPFLQRSKSSAGTSSAANAQAGRSVGRTPPLPPRKPQHFQTKPPVPLPGSSNVGSGGLSTSPTKPAIIPVPQRVPTFPHRDRDRDTHAHVPVPPLHPATASSSLVSPLMKQSLEASKMGQTLKKVQDQLEKERVLEVIKSSTPSTSASSSSVRGRIASDNRIFGSGGQYQLSLNSRRPVPSPPRSVGTTTSTSAAGSVFSYEQVASATIPNSSSFTSAGMRSRSPDRMTSSSGSQKTSRSRGSVSAGQKPSVDGPPLVPPPPVPPPPQHPDRRPSGVGHRHTSSLHSSWSAPSTAPDTDSAGNVATGRASPPLPPVPPPRRKRPESVQVFPSSRSGGASPVRGALDWTSVGGKDGTSVDGQSTSLSSMTRSMTLSSPARVSGSTSPERTTHHTNSERDVTSPSSSTSHNPLSFAALQRTFSQLQSKAQPKLDRARYKAEAGFSRRGFVPHGEQKILRDYEEEEAEDERGRDGYGPTTYSRLDDRGGGGVSEVGVVGAAADSGSESSEDDSGDPFGKAPGRLPNGSGAGVGGANGSGGGGAGRPRRLTREDIGMDDLKMPVGDLEGEGWTRIA